MVCADCRSGGGLQSLERVQWVGHGRAQKVTLSVGVVGEAGAAAKVDMSL